MRLLERIAELGAVLLRVERVAAPVADDDVFASAFLFTFDVGRILVNPDRAGGLRALHIDSRDAVPPDLEDASADEPWWRVIGSPLCRSSALGAGEVGARLQFRPDDENPRRIALVVEAGVVRSELEGAQG